MAIKKGVRARVVGNRGHSFELQEIVISTGKENKNNKQFTEFRNKDGALQYLCLSEIKFLSKKEQQKNFLKIKNKTSTGSKKMSYQFKVGDKVKIKESSPFKKSEYWESSDANVLKDFLEKGLKIDGVVNNWVNDAGEEMNGNYCYQFLGAGGNLRATDLELVVDLKLGDIVGPRDWKEKDGPVPEATVMKLENGKVLVGRKGVEPEYVPEKSVYLIRRPSLNPVKNKKGKLFESVILPEDHVSAIKEAISQAQESIKDKIFNQWGFGEVLEKGKGTHILFYGPPGTGKTLMAEAIAEILGRKLRIVGTAEVESSEPGGAERAIKAFFQAAKKDNMVLVFDECDSLIYQRSHVGMILAAQINCLLSEMEQFEGVCVYTTNNTPVLDPAFERRLSLKLEFPMPKKELRLKIWQRMFPVKEALHENVNLMEFAEWQIAGGTIKNIVLNAARRAAFRGKEKIEHEDLQFALEREKEGAKAFSQPRDLKSRVKMDYEVKSQSNIDIIKGGLNGI